MISTIEELILIRRLLHLLPCTVRWVVDLATRIRVLIIILTKMNILLQTASSILLIRHRPIEQCIPHLIRNLTVNKDPIKRLQGKLLHRAPLLLMPMDGISRLIRFQMPPIRPDLTRQDLQHQHNQRQQQLLPWPAFPVQHRYRAQVRLPWRHHRPLLWLSLPRLWLNRLPHWLPSLSSRVPVRVQVLLQARHPTARPTIPIKMSNNIRYHSCRLHCHFTTFILFGFETICL